MIGEREAHQGNVAELTGHDDLASAGIDGLPGLDFLRGQQLSIDFREGVITLQ